MQDGRTFLYVPQLVYGGLSVIAVNYTCDSSYPITNSSVSVSDSVSLMNALYTSADLSYHEVLVNTGTLVLATNWPADIRLSYGPLVVLGDWGEQQQQQPLLSLATSTFALLEPLVLLTFSNLVLMDGCSTLQQLAPGSHAQFASTAPLWAVVFDRCAGRRGPGRSVGWCASACMCMCVGGHAGAAPLPARA